MLQFLHDLAIPLIVALILFLAGNLSSHWASFWTIFQERWPHPDLVAIVDYPYPYDHQGNTWIYIGRPLLPCDHKMTGPIATQTVPEGYQRAYYKPNRRIYSIRQFASDVNGTLMVNYRLALTPRRSYYTNSHPYVVNRFTLAKSEPAGSWTLVSPDQPDSSSNFGRVYSVNRNIGQT